MPTETEAAIAELHQWFCERTGRETRLCFSQSLWYELLRDYEFKAAQLRQDAELIIRYLIKEIAGGRRNRGALKLSNFLQRDRFDEDLAEALQVLKRRPARPRTIERVQHVGDTQRIVEVPNPDNDAEQASAIAPRALRSLADELDAKNRTTSS